MPHTSITTNMVGGKGICRVPLASAAPKEVGVDSSAAHRQASRLATVARLISHPQSAVSAAHPDAGAHLQ
jgi:hypothetical protein